MNKDKQIEEMKLIIDKAEEEYSEIWNEWFYDHKEGTKIDNEFLFFAKMLYDAGYRKQSEGEWVGKTDYAGYGYYCSNCNAVFTGENAEWIAKEHYYCPKCGAKMKGR